jgi:hypothetical protein
LRQDLHQWRRNQLFAIRYRTQDANGFESPYRSGRLEEVDQSFYLNVADVPRPGFLEVEGLLDGASQFSSGWASAVAIQVNIS